MTDEVISPLRRRMIEDMTIRKLTPKTQQGYIRTIRNLAAFIGRSPDKASHSHLHSGCPHGCKYGREGRGGSGALQVGSTGAGGTADWRGSEGLCGSKTSVELPVHSQPMTPQNGEIATTGASPRSTSTPFVSGPPLTL